MYVYMRYLGDESHLMLVCPKYIFVILKNTKIIQNKVK